MSSHPTPEPKPPINYVFVDYENVHDVNLSLIGSKTVHLTLLLGARQTKLDVDLVEKLMAHSSSVQLVRLESSGKNALDFALAFYVGRAAQADPNAYFHIVSKDTGFDPLIEHLRSRHINARRHADYTALTFSAAPKLATSEPAVPKPPTPKPAASKQAVAKPTAAEPNDLLNRVLEHLRKNTTNRPKRKKTLGSHLAAFCGKSSTAAEVEALIENLRTAGHLKIGDKEAVTYHLNAK